MEQRRAIIMHFVTSHPQCSLSLLHVLLYSIKPFDAVVDGVSIWIAIGLLPCHPAAFINFFAYIQSARRLLLRFPPVQHEVFQPHAYTFAHYKKGS